MTRRGAWSLVLALAVGTAAPAGALAEVGGGLGAAVAASAPMAAAPEQAGRQVLVMLRLPPVHARPGADYGDAYGDGLGRAARRRVAGRIAREHGLTLLSDWPMPLLGIDCFIMATPLDQSPEKIAATLSADPAVAWSQPMNVFHAQSADQTQGAHQAQSAYQAQNAYRAQGAPLTHNDPLYRVQPAAREWRLADLHQIATGRRVRVAVIDSMVETTHPDLAGQVAISENFVQGQSNLPEQHGTGVAGIIAARADNGIGIAGVAPGARLMALRACWQEPAAVQRPTQTICDSLALAKALQFAVGHDAQVINLSLSGPRDTLLGKLLDIALVRGTAVVSAYDRDLPRGGFPASHPGVVAVVDGGSGPPIAGVLSAPGRDVPTTQPGGRWYFVNGASYAAAHVSGLFALLRERSAGRRELSALVVARPDGSIDTCSTLMRASGPCDCACARASVSSVQPRL